MIDFDAGSPQKRKAPPISAMNLTAITLVIAVLGLICMLIKVYTGSVVFGAVGLVLGGYSMGFINRHVADSRNKFMTAAGASLLISVIAFMFGFVELVGAI